MMRLLLLGPSMRRAHVPSPRLQPERIMQDCKLGNAGPRQYSRMLSVLSPSKVALDSGRGMPYVQPTRWKQVKHMDDWPTLEKLIIYTGRMT
jgi:hypothetical protein